MVVAVKFIGIFVYVSSDVLTCFVAVEIKQVKIPIEPCSAVFLEDVEHFLFNLMQHIESNKYVRSVVHCLNRT